MTLATFTILYNHHHCPFPKYFTIPNSVPIKQFQPSPLSPWQPLFYFLSMNLPILGISDKWNHTIIVLLCLSSLFYLACYQGSSMLHQSFFFHLFSVFLMTASLMCVKWYLFVLLIYVSFMTDDAEFLSCA